MLGPGLTHTATHGGSGESLLPTPPATSEPSPSVTSPETPTPDGTTSSGPSAADKAARDAAVTALLDRRAVAITNHDRASFLGVVDSSATSFLAAQADVFDRVSSLPVQSWTYVLTGAGPELTASRDAELPAGSAILRVRLTYRLSGTDTSTDREQLLTVVPRDGAWLLSSDTDGSASGFDTERDLWDLGDVSSVRGRSSLVVADSRATKAEMRRLAREADTAVAGVDKVWTHEWSRHPVVVLPRTQADMAVLIGGNGDGLAQIAAVTTGTFESGLSRGDRIVINPGAWDTLGPLGRQVVLTHEMTHVATRSSSAASVPIWLSEGFADYVAYRTAPVPLSIVASDVLDEVRAGKGPRELPVDKDFDASRGDIASSYEGAWLACRMIATKYGEGQLVGLYAALADGEGAGWPAETVEVLGVSDRTLVTQWRAFLRAKAGSRAS